MYRLWWIPVGLLCLMSTARAIGDFTGFQGNVDAVTSLGIDTQALPYLGATKLAGVAGLLVGVRMPRLGALAAGCLVAYHGVAATLHLTVGAGLFDAAPALITAVVAALALPAYALRFRPRAT